MYRYRYINKMFQFGETSYSLILQDLESGMPTVRIEKTFNVDPLTIDENFLYDQAAIEITNAIQAYNDAQIAAENAANTDASQDDSGDQ